MELKVSNRTAYELKNYLGLPEERLLDLSLQVTNAIFRYIDSITEITIYDNDEHKLLVECIGYCKSWEEAIYLALTFREVLSTAVREEARRIINEKLNSN